MKAKVLSLVLLGSVLLGCASTTDDFKRAQDKDTIVAYQEFVRQHPNSEYTNIAKKRIMEIQKEKEEKSEQAKQSRLEAIAKIRKYVPGSLTDDEFFAEGWNALDPYLEKIGILDFTEKDDSAEGMMNLTVNMGFFIGYDLKEEGRFADIIQSTFNFLLESRKLGNQVVSSKGGFRIKNEGKYIPPRKVCTLIFKNGQLDSVEWYID